MLYTSAKLHCCNACSPVSGTCWTNKGEGKGQHNTILPLALITYLLTFLAARYICNCWCLVHRGQAVSALS